MNSDRGTGIWTIGHSNHTTTEFMNLLATNRIQRVVDVRSTPYSSHTPWFDETELPELLRRNQIDYKHMGRDLGGRPTNPEHYGPNGRAQYDLMALTRNFKSGLIQLARYARETPTAIMCTEKDPLRCHRTLMVCHELTAMETGTAGLEIGHILADGAVITHTDLMDQLMKNLRLTPEPRWLQASRAVRTQSEKVAYRRKQT